MSIQPNEPQRPNRNYLWFLIAFFLTFGIIAFVLIVPNNHNNKQKKLFEEARLENTIDAYKNYLKEYPKSAYSDIARDSIVSICKRECYINDIPVFNELDAETESMYQYLHIPVPQNDFDQETQTRLRDLQLERIDKAYREASTENTIEGWYHYMEIVPYNDRRDAERRIKYLKEDQQRQIEEAKRARQQEEEAARWETDDVAWETAEARNNIHAYKKYLKLFPYGNHCGTAQERIIDLEVDKIFSEEHSQLPPMEKGYSTGAPYSVVEIENRTDYQLTINYSGPHSRKIVIQPHDTKETRIDNGNYRVTATVGHGITPYAGRENLDGSYYSGYYYIVTTKY